MKSDFARLAAVPVAMAASDGFITTKMAAGLYDNCWRITPAGLQRLFILKGMSDN
nr:hypothetical protein [Methylobacterium sp. ZNC0032]